MLCHLPSISSDLLGLGRGRIPHWWELAAHVRTCTHQVLTQNSWHGAGDQVLRELPSPGKSGSVFFVSNDERYMIKTMRKVSQHLRTCAETSRLCAWGEQHPDSEALLHLHAHFACAAGDERPPT